MSNARGLKIALLALITFCVSWVAMPGSAQADVRLAGTPSGWSSEADAVEDRAAAWAEAVGGTLVEVYGPAGAETDSDLIVLIETPGQLTGSDLEDPTALANTYAPVFEVDEASSVATVELGEGLPPGVRARFEGGEAVVELLVVSAGDNRALLVFATTPDGEKLYGSLFDTAIDDLAGVEGPAQRFDHGTWWMGFAGGWVVVTLLLVVILRLASAGETATQIGRRAAAVLVGLSILVMGGSYVALAGSEASINATGLTRLWLVAEAGLIGLAAAGVLMVVASIISAASRPIQSAPTGGGTWAERPANPFVPIVPQAPPVSGHPDGVGELADAHDPIPAGPPSAPVAAPPPPPSGGPPPPAPASPTSPASALADGTLTAPSPAALSGSGPLSGSSVAPARTAPIVLRGSENLPGSAAPAPPGTAHVGAPEQPVRIDRTLVGQGPKAKPVAFPAPMSSPPPPPSPGDDD